MTLARDVIAIEIEWGRTVYVTPLSAFAARAISQRALEKFPDPDPTPFEKPLPDAVIEGEVLPATNDPEYVALVTDTRNKRNLYIHAAILAMTQIEGVSRDELIGAYKEQLTVLRTFGELPEDDYVAALRTFVLKPADYAAIVLAATNKMPLSQGEILDGLRIFRPVLQRRDADGSGGEASAPHIPEGEQVQTQQPTG